jgi:hypothetical protein
VNSEGCQDFLYVAHDLRHMSQCLGGQDFQAASLVSTKVLHFNIDRSCLSYHISTDIVVLLRFRHQMAAQYRTIPATALTKPEPFHISIPGSSLQDFKTLLKLSKVPAPTYESLQGGGKF